MKHHYAIWRITVVVVLAATVMFLVWEVGREPNRSVPPSEEANNGRLVQAMLELIDEDPQARRPETKAVVEALATLAERKAVLCAETYYALGVRLRGEQDFERAEEAFRLAIQMAPDWSRPYDGLGYVLYSLGRAEQSEANLRKAIALDPTWGRAHSDLSVVLRLQGRFVESEQYARRAVALDSDSLAAQNTLANVLVSLKRFDEAAECYRKAIAIDPQHPTPYYNIACLRSIQGRPDQALSFLEKAIELDPAFRQQAKDDPDLESLRGMSAFEKLILGDG